VGFQHSQDLEKISNKENYCNLKSKLETKANSMELVPLKLGYCANLSCSTFTIQVFVLQYFLFSMNVDHEKECVHCKQICLHLNHLFLSRLVEPLALSSLWRLNEAQCEF
jgi:hypothetical protein